MGSLLSIKLISILVSGLAGAGLAVAAALGVVHSNTAPPSSNPAANVVVSYGSR